MSSHKIALALVLSAGSLAAQNITVPAGMSELDANFSSGFPFAYDQIRMQQVWTGEAIAATSATLTDIAWRGEIQSLPMNAFVMQDVTAFLSHTSVTPETMVERFENNITSAQTVVFRGNLDVPAQPQVPGRVTPWNIVMPFDQPFGYTTSQGNLMFEMVTPEKPIYGRTDYFIDAALRGGNEVRFGTSGLQGIGTSVQPGAVGIQQSLVPGGSVRLATITPQYYPGSIHIGTSAESYLGIPLPINLAAIGAPGNFLYTGPELGSLPLNPTELSPGGLWRSLLILPVPSTSAAVGLTLYAQSIVLAPTANPLGLATTNGVAFHIGDSSAPPTQVVGIMYPTRPVGIFHYRTNGPGGPVVRFGGTFQ